MRKISGNLLIVLLSFLLIGSACCHGVQADSMRIATMYRENYPDGHYWAKEYYNFCQGSTIYFVIGNSLGLNDDDGEYLANLQLYDPDGKCVYNDDDSVEFTELDRDFAWIVKLHCPNNAKVGKYKAVVNLYSTYPHDQLIAKDSVTYFNVTKKIPSVTVKSVKSPKKSRVTVSWKKKKGVTGYVVTFFMPGSRKDPKQFTFSSKKTSCTIKGLKSKSKVYVGVKAYKKVNGHKVYGPLKVKSIKVK